MSLWQVFSQKHNIEAFSGSNAERLERLVVFPQYFNTAPQRPTAQITWSQIRTYRVSYDVVQQIERYYYYKC